MGLGQEQNVSAQQQAHVRFVLARAPRHLPASGTHPLLPHCIGRSGGDHPDLRISDRTQCLVNGASRGDHIVYQNGASWYPTIDPQRG